MQQYMELYMHAVEILALYFSYLLGADITRRGKVHSDNVI